MRCVSIAAALALAIGLTDTCVMPDFVAELYAGAGQAGLALDWLDKAHEDRSITLAYLAVKPIWDVLRDKRASRICCAG